MSMELMVQAMKTLVGDPLAKLVLIKLADNANDLGECWPSYQHVADQCEISRRTAMRHIQALEAAGFLRKEERFGGPKGNSSNLFRLTIRNGRPLVNLQGGVVSQSHQGSVTESPGGSVTESPRTSHSSEPVNEPSCGQQADHIPYAAIFQAYAEALPELPQLKVKDEARRKAIRSIWKMDKRFQSLQHWQKYFRYVKTSPFLMGMNAIGFDWLLKPANFKKVIEGNYHGENQHRA